MLVAYLLGCIVLIVVLTSRLRIHPFIVLLLVGLTYGFLAGMPSDQIVASVNEGFGKTLSGIGLIIVLGVIIGVFLENTGGAYAIAEKILRFLGKKNVTPAMGIMGYVVSIPVYADSGFLLLSPLKKSLCKSAGLTLSGATIALSLGLTVSHTMVPPTPGPIAAAGILDANLGQVLLIGLPVSLIALAVSILFAMAYVSRIHIDPSSTGATDAAPAPSKDSPSALKSLLPIIVPIGLILSKSVAQMLQLPATPLLSIINFLGTPFIALLAGTFLALLLPKKLELNMLSCDGWIGKALTGSASIILITGAGGAFGKILQNSGIATGLGTLISEWSLGIWLPFLLAAAIKTAQGSSTVALITTASILAPLMGELGFVSELDKALVVIAIGAGSAVVSHANDSFFWVVTQMSGMDVRTGYRTHTLGTLVMGTSSALVVFGIYSTFS
ncbi:GntP family permease [Gilvimarinus sp. SDUM040013]|uniref:GntP family permease n=1 Tax=Gilvimarinus gilvus TaxID=3058038 RepID=A0ABU4S0D3_9GAMM|nr:GntP family permease [Gilvimarinus sp. SDUM040013]MDO3385878.1 GntP family permease [Gilvimarinus sp. SDUM040013]MDX6850619.1 GntP family permease [Gilvimarinus sp. SDUM040013]